MTAGAVICNLLIYYYMVNLTTFLMQNYICM